MPVLAPIAIPIAANGIKATGGLLAGAAAAGKLGGIPAAAKGLAGLAALLPIAGAFAPLLPIPIVFPEPEPNPVPGIDPGLNDPEPSPVPIFEPPSDDPIFPDTPTIPETTARWRVNYEIVTEESDLVLCSDPSNVIRAANRTVRQDSYSTTANAIRVLMDPAEAKNVCDGGNPRFEDKFYFQIYKIKEDGTEQLGESLRGNDGVRNGAAFHTGIGNRRYVVVQEIFRDDEPQELPTYPQPEPETDPRPLPITPIPLSPPDTLPLPGEVPLPEREPEPDPLIVPSPNNPTAPPITIPRVPPADPVTPDRTAPGRGPVITPIQPGIYPTPGTDPIPGTNPEIQPGVVPLPTPIPGIPAVPEPSPDPNPQPAPGPEPQPAPGPEPIPSPNPSPEPEPSPQPEPEPNPLPGVTPITTPTLPGIVPVPIGAFPIRWPWNNKPPANNIVPIKVTPPNQHFPVSGGPPATPGGARGDIGSIANEVGRIEAKSASLLDKVNSALNFLQLLNDLIGDGDAEPYEWRLTGICEEVPEGEDQPYQLWQGPFMPVVRQNNLKLDHIAQMLQVHLGYKTPTCNTKQTFKPVGDWRTIAFISDDTSPYGKSRLRKRFRYRSTSGLGLDDVINHWKDFVWEAGPVCVAHADATWGTPQCWAASADEGKRVIRHAGGEAGIDPDQVGRWVVSGSDNPRFGVPGTMRVRTQGGYYWITARDGSDGRPIVGRT